MYYLVQVLAFLKTYWYIFGPLFSLGAVNVANALLKYPETETLGHTILDRLSVLARSDSLGTLKMLGKRSKNPNQLPAIISKS